MQLESIATRFNRRSSQLLPTTTAAAAATSETAAGSAPTLTPTPSPAPVVSKPAGQGVEDDVEKAVAEYQKNYFPDSADAANVSDDAASADTPIAVGACGIACAANSSLSKAAAASKMSMLFPTVDAHSEAEAVAADGAATQGAEAGAEAEGVETQGAETQGVETQGAETQGAETQGAGTQGVETQGAETQGAKSQGAETQGAETQGAEAEGVETQGAETQGAETQGAGTQGVGTQGAETQGAKSQGAETQGAEAEGVETQGAETQGAGTQGAGTQGAGTQGAGTQGAGTQGAETQGAETQGAEAGAEAEGVETQGAETEGVEIQGAETQGAGTQGAGTQGVETQGAETQGAKSQGDETQGAEAEGVETQGAETQGAETQGAETQGAEAEGVQTQGAETQGAETQGAETQGAGTQGAETQGAEAEGVAAEGSDVIDGKGYSEEEEEEREEAPVLPASTAMLQQQQESTPLEPLTLELEVDEEADGEEEQEALIETKDMDDAISSANEPAAYLATKNAPARQGDTGTASAAAASTSNEAAGAFKDGCIGVPTATSESTATAPSVTGETDYTAAPDVDGGYATPAVSTTGDPQGVRIAGTTTDSDSMTAFGAEMSNTAPVTSGLASQLDETDETDIIASLPSTSPLASTAPATAFPGSGPGISRVGSVDGTPRSAVSVEFTPRSVIDNDDKKKKSKKERKEEKKERKERKERDKKEKKALKKQKQALATGSGQGVGADDSSSGPDEELMVAVSAPVRRRTSSISAIVTMRQQSATSLPSPSAASASASTADSSALSTSDSAAKSFSPIQSPSQLHPNPFSVTSSLQAGPNQTIANTYTEVPTNLPTNSTTPGATEDAHTGSTTPGATENAPPDTTTHGATENAPPDTTTHGATENAPTDTTTHGATKDAPTEITITGATEDVPTDSTATRATEDAPTGSPTTRATEDAHINSSLVNTSAPAGEAHVGAETGAAAADAPTDTSRVDASTPAGDADVDAETGAAAVDTLTDTSPVEASAPAGDADVGAETGAAAADAPTDTSRVDAAPVGEAHVGAETGAAAVDTPTDTSPVEASAPESEAHVGAETGAAAADAPTDTSRDDASAPAGDADVDAETGAAAVDTPTDTSPVEASASDEPSTGFPLTVYPSSIPPVNALAASSKLAPRAGTSNVESGSEATKGTQLLIPSLPKSRLNLMSRTDSDDVSWALSSDAGSIDGHRTPTAALAPASDGGGGGGGGSSGSGVFGRSVGGAVGVSMHRGASASASSIIEANVDDESATHSFKHSGSVEGRSATHSLKHSGSVRGRSAEGKDHSLTASLHQSEKKNPDLEGAVTINDSSGSGSTGDNVDIDTNAVGKVDVDIAAAAASTVENEPLPPPLRQLPSLDQLVDRVVCSADEGDDSGVHDFGLCTSADSGVNYNEHSPSEVRVLIEYKRPSPSPSLQQQQDDREQMGDKQGHNTPASQASQRSLDAASSMSSQEQVEQPSAKHRRSLDAASMSSRFPSTVRMGVQLRTSMLAPSVSALTMADASASGDNNAGGGGSVGGGGGLPQGNSSDEEDRGERGTIVDSSDDEMPSQHSDGSSVVFIPDNAVATEVGREKGWDATASNLNDSATEGAAGGTAWDTAAELGQLMIDLSAIAEIDRTEVAGCDSNSGEEKKGREGVEGSGTTSRPTRHVLEAPAWCQEEHPTAPANQGQTAAIVSSRAVKTASSASSCQDGKGGKAGKASKAGTASTVEQENSVRRPTTKNQMSSGFEADDYDDDDPLCSLAIDLGAISDDESVRSGESFCISVGIDAKEDDESAYTAENPLFGSSRSLPVSRRNSDALGSSPFDAVTAAVGYTPSPIGFAIDDAVGYAAHRPLFSPRSATSASASGSRVAAGAGVVARTGFMSMPVMTGASAASASPEPAAGTATVPLPRGGSQGGGAQGRGAQGREAQGRGAQGRGGARKLLRPEGGRGSDRSSTATARPHSLSTGIAVTTPLSTPKMADGTPFVLTAAAPDSSPERKTSEPPNGDAGALFNPLQARGNDSQPATVQPAVDAAGDEPFETAEQVEAAEVSSIQLAAEMRYHIPHIHLRSFTLKEIEMLAVLPHCFPDLGDDDGADVDATGNGGGGAQASAQRSATGLCNTRDPGTKSLTKVRKAAAVETDSDSNEESLHHLQIDLHADTADERKYEHGIEETSSDRDNLSVVSPVTACTDGAADAIVYGSNDDDDDDDEKHQQSKALVVSKIIQSVASAKRAVNRADRDPNKGFIELRIEYGGFKTPIAFEQFESRYKFPRVKILSLRGNAIKDAAALELSEQFFNLVEVDLSLNKICRGITETAFPYTLVRLNLQNNRITDTSALMSCIHLKELNLSHNRIETISSLPFTLHSLDLSYNYIWRPVNLRVLALCVQLETLNLEGNPVSILDKNFRQTVRSLFPKLKVSADSQHVSSPKSKQRMHSSPDRGDSSPSRKGLRLGTGDVALNNEGGIIVRQAQIRQHENIAPNARNGSVRGKVSGKCPSSSKRSNSSSSRFSSTPQKRVSYADAKSSSIPGSSTTALSPSSSPATTTPKTRVDAVSGATGDETGDEGGDERNDIAVSSRPSEKKKEASSTRLSTLRPESLAAQGAVPPLAHGVNSSARGGGGRVRGGARSVSNRAPSAISSGSRRSPPLVAAASTSKKSLPSRANGASKTSVTSPPSPRSPTKTTATTTALRGAITVRGVGGVDRDIKSGTSRAGKGKGTAVGTSSLPSDVSSKRYTSFSNFAASKKLCGATTGNATSAGKRSRASTVSTDSFQGVGKTSHSRGVTAAPPVGAESKPNTQLVSPWLRTSTTAAGAAATGGASATGGGGTRSTTPTSALRSGCGGGGGNRPSGYGDVSMFAPDTSSRKMSALLSPVLLSPSSSRRPAGTAVTTSTAPDGAALTSGGGGGGGDCSGGVVAAAFQDLREWHRSLTEQAKACIFLLRRVIDSSSRRVMGAAPSPAQDVPHPYSGDGDGASHVAAPPPPPSPLPARLASMETAHASLPALAAAFRLDLKSLHLSGIVDEDGNTDDDDDGDKAKILKVDVKYQQAVEIVRSYSTGIDAASGVVRESTSSSSSTAGKSESAAGLSFKEAAVLVSSIEAAHSELRLLVSTLARVQGAFDLLCSQEDQQDQQNQFAWSAFRTALDAIMCDEVGITVDRTLLGKAYALSVGRDPTAASSCSSPPPPSPPASPPPPDLLPPISPYISALLQASAHPSSRRPRPQEQSAAADSNWIPPLHGSESPARLPPATSASAQSFMHVDDKREQTDSPDPEFEYKVIDIDVDVATDTGVEPRSSPAGGKNLRMNSAEGADRPQCSPSPPPPPPPPSPHPAPPLPLLLSSLDGSLAAEQYQMGQGAREKEQEHEQEQEPRKMTQGQEQQLRKLREATSGAATLFNFVIDVAARVAPTDSASATPQDISQTSETPNVLQACQLTCDDFKHFQGECQTLALSELLHSVDNDNIIPDSNNQAMSVLLADVKSYLQFFQRVEKLMRHCLGLEAGADATAVTPGMNRSPPVTAPPAELGSPGGTQPYTTTADHYNRGDGSGRGESDTIGGELNKLSSFAAEFDLLMDTQLGQAVNQAAFYIYDRPQP